ncbi:MAG: ATPase [Rhodothermaceae bacterium]|nr:MAG: ATPase [Rhodothermaceae bacterium]
MSSRDAHEATSSRTGRRTWRPWVEAGLILLFWTLIAALTIGRRAIDPRGPQEGLRAGQVLQTLLEFGLWAVFTPLIFWFIHRFGLERDNWLRRLALHAVMAVAVAALFDFIGLKTYFALVRHESVDYSLMKSLLGLRFLDELIVYLTVLAAGIARDYFVRYQERQAEAAMLRTQAARLKAQLAEAHLQALRMQVNPHFLFNTLHAVSSLVERDPKGVRRMIVRLSELLRYTLERTGEQEVTLQEELDFLERYLDIERIRFQDRLEVVRDIQPETLEALVPSLVLQPLVENAIKHGVSRIEETGRIEIAAWRRGGYLYVSVSDNGPGLPAVSGNGFEVVGEGVGLRNTRERLRSLYGEAQELRLEQPETGGLRVLVRIPYHTRSDLYTAVTETA